MKLKKLNIKRGETKKFILACPAEDCRGFLSENYKCDLCQQTTCPDCNEIMEEGHTCDEEAVQSAELIKKELNHVLNVVYVSLKLMVVIKCSVLNVMLHLVGELEDLKRELFIILTFINGNVK